jgi:hypothetical protein
MSRYLVSTCLQQICGNLLKQSLCVPIHSTNVNGYVKKTGGPHGTLRRANQSPAEESHESWPLHTLGCRPYDSGNSCFEAQPTTSPLHKARPPSVGSPMLTKGTGE